MAGQTETKNKDEQQQKKKNKNMDVFEFCKVCNLNQDQGRRHIYFPNHKRALSSFFTRFLRKISDVRFFLKNPTVLHPELASRNRFWCVFCESDIDELGSSFAWYSIQLYHYLHRFDVIGFSLFQFLKWLRKDGGYFMNSTFANSVLVQEWK